MPVHIITPRKPTWQWKSHLIFNRRYIDSFMVGCLPASRQTRSYRVKLPCWSRRWRASPFDLRVFFFSAEVQRKTKKTGENTHTHNFLVLKCDRMGKKGGENTGWCQEFLEFVGWELLISWIFGSCEGLDFIQDTIFKVIPSFMGKLRVPPWSPSRK